MSLSKIQRNPVKRLSPGLVLGLAMVLIFQPFGTIARAMMGMMHGEHGADVPFVQEEGEYRPLKIPEILEPDSKDGVSRHYMLTMDEGKTEFREGFLTDTLGYNGTYLGPTLVLNRGEEVSVTLRNRMAEETTVHWHGLLVPSYADGGPHQEIGPEEEREIAFSVKQEAATLWYHPHTLGKTAEQVYNGLAGFLLIRDDNELSKGLPSAYGVDDLPLVVQDRSFTGSMGFDYGGTYNPDGTYGETILANGTIHAAFDVTTELLRIRLLNGSNARIYDFRLSNGRPILQIGSDGGLLNGPVQTQSLRLTPGERAELLISMSGMQPGESLDLLSGDTSVLRLNVPGELKANGDIPEALNNLPEAADSGAVDRRFVLFGMGLMVSINGDVFDMNRVDERGVTGRDEVWEIYNRPDMMGGMVHNFHLHGTQFRVLTRDGAPPPMNERGWKDTVALDSDERVHLLVRFEDEGLFMYHCHILEHEDNGMMGQIEIKAQ